MNSPKRNDPKYIGPGKWDSMHIESIAADTEEKQIIFCENVRYICKNFPCEHCKEHCENEIKLDPPEKFIGTKVNVGNEYLPLGMAVWAWTFHNKVNLRLNKELMSWDNFLNIYYYPKKECSEKCKISHIHNDEKKVDLTKLPNSPKIIRMK